MTGAMLNGLARTTRLALARPHDQTPDARRKQLRAGRGFPNYQPCKARSFAGNFQILIWKTKGNSMSSIHADFVRYRLAGSSAWRQRLSQKFPDDIRNKHAADALGKLARDDTVSAETLVALAPYVDKPQFIDAVSVAAKDVFFRSRPETLDDFLRLVLAKLDTPVGAK
jgi:hypothetical protein